MDEGSTKVATIADEDIVGCLVNGIWSLADWALVWCGASVTPRSSSSYTHLASTP